MQEVENKKQKMTIGEFLKIYGITFAAALVCFFLFIIACGLFKPDAELLVRNESVLGLFEGLEDTAKASLLRYRILSDGGMLVGAVLIGVGLIIFASNQGTFDGLTYSMSGIVRQFIPGSGLLKPKNKYAEYVKNRHQTSAKFVHLIYVGLVFLLFSVIMLVCYEVLLPAPPTA